MELGATVCLPRAPRCSECPVREPCRTRGEHRTIARAPQRSLPVACLLDMRKRGPATEVLLERRPRDASVMPAMVELPALPLEAVEGLEPALRIRHAITNTNYYVQVFSPRRGATAQALRRAIPADTRESAVDAHHAACRASAYRAYAQDSATSKGYGESAHRASRMRD